MNKKAIVISIDGLGMNAWGDPALPVPHLRRLATVGSEAAVMLSITPAATWAIHTSLVTGTSPRRHGVLGNWVIDRKTNALVEHYGERAGGKEETVAGTTIYDAVKMSGGTTAAICWPKTRGAVNLDYNIPEFYEQEGFEQYSTPSLWRELREAGLPVDCYGAWSKDHSRGAMQDWLSTEVAKYVLRWKETDLLLLHYLVTDSYQHDYGACSRELYWAAGYVDSLVGDLLRTLDEQELLEETDIFVLSDHGLTDADRGVYLNVLLKQHGLFDAEQPERSRVRAVSNGGSAYVYVLSEDAAERAALVEQVQGLLRGTEGIARILTDGEMEAWGLPEAGEMERWRPDIVLEAESDSFFNMGFASDQVIVRREKPVGMHGYFADHPSSDGFFFASGPSIRQGGKLLKAMSAVDVAPTIARLYGVGLSEAEGTELSELWRVSRQDG